MAEVFVIDDELTWLKLYDMAFSDLGHTVRGASDGDEALREISEHQADVVILDIRMAPSGLEVFRTLRRKWPHIPIVISSLYGGYRNDPGLASADGFVVKSADVTDLVNAVEEALASRRRGAGPATGHE